MARSAITYMRGSVADAPPVSQPLTAPTLLLPLTTSASAGVTIPSGTVSTTRGGVQWCPNESGVYYQYGANILSYNTLGVFVEPGRTNTCTNYNADPGTSTSNVTASGGTLSAYSDVAALAAAGLANICPGGKVFRLVNTSGSTQTATITGIIASASAASMRAWARCSGGTATMQFYNGATATGAITIQVGTALVEYRKENVTHTDANDQLQFSVPNGVTLDFILNQIEVGANTTTPIVTTGASASRTAVGITLQNASNIPANDFVMYCEVTPYGYAQDSSAAVPLSAYQDANNRYQISLGAPPGASRTIVGATTTATGRSCNQTETMKCAARYSRASGQDCFINGAQSAANDPLTTDLTLSSGNLHIGRKGDSSQYLTGRIRNVKIFSYAMANDVLRQLTTPDTWSIRFFPNYGAPCFDTVVKGRLYSMAYNASTSAWRDIYYSDDWGVNWTLYASTAGAAAQETVCCDSSGNLYYASSAALKRIAAGTKTETTAVTFVANTNALGTATPVTGPSAIGNVWTWLNWHFTEDNAGNVYVGQYQIATGQFGGQYMWKSAAGGASFARVDTLMDAAWGGGGLGTTTERHIHNLKGNPFDGSVLFSCGDGANRGTFKSTNALAAGVFATDVVGGAGLTDATGTKGPTGITFSSEAAYLGTDSSGNQNYLKSVTGTTATARFTFPNPLQLTPAFWIGACGDNEMWVALCEDDLTKLEWSCLIKLTKKSGVDNQWEVARVISYESARFNGSQLYQMSVDARGMIPISHPYVFVSRRIYTAAQSGSPGFFRIAR